MFESPFAPVAVAIVFVLLAGVVWMAHRSQP